MEATSTNVTILDDRSYCEAQDAVFLATLTKGLIIMRRQTEWCQLVMGAKGHSRLGMVQDEALGAITMIDPATGWFEVKDITAALPEDACMSTLDDTWLSRYQQLQYIGSDHGNK